MFLNAILFAILFFANIRLGGYLFIWTFRMTFPGSDRRREQCLRNVVTTSLYCDKKNIKIDQFLKFTPGLNDEFDGNEDPGEEVMAIFHSAKQPGKHLARVLFMIFCSNAELSPFQEKFQIKNLGARNEGFILTTQNASAAHSIDTQCSMIKNFLWAEIEVTIEELEFKKRPRAKWYILINKECSLRQLMSVFAARLRSSTDIDINDELNTLILSVAEDLHFSHVDKKLILGIYDDVDFDQKCEIMNSCHDLSEDEKIATFDCLRRKIAEDQDFFDGYYKASSAEFDDSILFQNILKMHRNVNLKR